MFFTPACVVKSKNFRNRNADFALIIYNHLTQIGFVKEPTFKSYKDNTFLYASSSSITSALGLVTVKKSFSTFYVLVENISDEEYVFSVQNYNKTLSPDKLNTWFEEIFDNLRLVYGEVLVTGWFEGTQLPKSMASNPVNFRKLIRKFWKR